MLFTSIYTHWICQKKEHRTISNFYNLLYRSGESVMHGIHTDRFQLSPSVFANSTECPGHHCYNNNLPTGVQVSSPSAKLFC